MVRMLALACGAVGSRARLSCGWGGHRMSARSSGRMTLDRTRRALPQSERTPTTSDRPESTRHPSGDARALLRLRSEFKTGGTLAQLDSDLHALPADTLYSHICCLQVHVLPPSIAEGTLAGDCERCCSCYTPRNCHRASGTAPRRSRLSHAIGGISPASQHR